MGKYFMMSNRFNKQSPGDFGLIDADEEDCAICPIDNSRWLRCSLYDFGWGRETGYYREPLPCFSKLLQILIDSNDSDDMYGAAAIIMDKYPNALLEYCEESFDSSVNKDSARKIIKVLQLDQCINRSPIQGKSFDEITNDFTRWQALSKRAQSIMKKTSIRKIWNLR